MKRAARLAISIALCLPAVAIAQSYDQCMTAASGIDPKMRDCNNAELARRDAALNTLYAALLAELPPPRQALLRNAERAWLAFRDTECAFRASSEAGGTAQRLIAATCRLTLTGERIAALEQARKIAKF